MRPNGDPFLNEIGTFSGRNGDPNVFFLIDRKKTLDSSKLLVCVITRNQMVHIR